MIETLEQAQTLNEIGNVKKLEGGGHHYRVRIGDYRVGLFLEKEIITFVRILNRKDIYRHFP